MKRLALAMCCAAVSATASAGLFGPSTWDECILANMKGVGSDMAARAVAEACTRQFPPKKPAEKSAPLAAPSAKEEPAARPKPGEFTDIRLDPPK